MAKTFAVDIDGVLCYTDGTDYENAIPKRDNIEKINILYDAGNRIIIFTGRGSVSGKDWSSLTKSQLSEWGVEYHELIFGKPHFDVFIDDHAWNVKDFEIDYHCEALL